MGLDELNGAYFLYNVAISDFLFISTLILGVFCSELNSCTWLDRKFPLN